MLRIFDITKAFKYAIVIIAIPSIIFICTRILNRILSDAIMEIVENCLNNVDYLIGSKRTNTILSIVSIVLVIKIAKRLTRLLTQDKKDDD